MNNKILSAVLIAGITATGFAGLSSANNTDSSENTVKEWKWFDADKDSTFRESKKDKFHRKHELTQEEKTALESMSDEEKQDFFQAKRDEKQAEMEAKKLQREAKESVIDALLAGETLTTQQETLREEIIIERAERKAKMAEMEAKREQLQSILKKKDAGEALSEEEQTILNEMKSKKSGHKGGRR